MAKTKKQADSGVYKIVEVIGTSPVSWEDAAKRAVQTAAASLRDLRIAEVTKTDVKIEDGQVVAYRVRLALSFKYDPAQGRVLAIDSLGGEYQLLRGVEKFEIKFEPLRSQESKRVGGVYDKLMRATILLTIRTTGNSTDVDESVAAQTITLSTAVMPRRTVW